MLFNLPQTLQYFFQITFMQFTLMSPEQRNYVKATVCAILFHPGKVTMQVIGSILPNFQRTKSAVSKMYSNSYFYTQEVAWRTVIILCNMAYKRMPYSKKKHPWVLIFDTTHRSRFGKLLDNMIGSHGENSKKRTYAFVWPLLITPTADRISLPCLSWYRFEYAKKNNLAYHTQPQLAVLALKYLFERLKKTKLDFDLVIVTDSSFECKELWELCQKHNQNNISKWTLITTCTKDRCLGSNGSKASRLPGKKVHEHMKKVPLTHKKKKVDIMAQTGIELRSQPKLQAKKSGKTSHFYSYAKQQLRVADFGDTNVVISYKLKSFNQKLSDAPFKVLLCNNLDFSAEQIISYFSLRWEVETFFREQKSNLPFKDLQPWNCHSCYKFVDLLGVSFNALEFYRLQLIDSSDPQLSESLKWIRTSGLRNLLQKQATADSLDWMHERSKTNFGSRRLRKCLEVSGIHLKSLPLLRLSKV